RSPFPNDVLRQPCPFRQAGLRWGSFHSHGSELHTPAGHRGLLTDCPQSAPPSIELQSCSASSSLCGGVNGCPNYTKVGPAGSTSSRPGASVSLSTLQRVGVG